MESDQISKETKKELKATYLALNPAQLKRTIDIKLDKLYQEKGRSQEVKPDSTRSISVTYLNDLTRQINFNDSLVERCISLAPLVDSYYSASGGGLLSL